MDGSADSFPDGYSAEAARARGDWAEVDSSAGDWAEVDSSAADWAEVDSSAADCWESAALADLYLAQRGGIAERVALPGVRLLQEECRDGSRAVVFLDSPLESAWRACREGPA